MTTETCKGLLSESSRKMIFLALVDAQDRKITVAESRRLMMERFHVTESRVRQIELEGMDNQWPPLK
jgi:hypothetical protein